MKRISTTTSVVNKFGAGKNGFTNGNVVGGIPATDLEDAWFDGVQEEIANVVEDAGIVLDGNDRTQLLQAIRRRGPGVAGTARNLRAAQAAAGASITFTADELVVATALGGGRYVLANVNRTLNVGTVGAGGMDTGAAPTSGWVAIYAIYNPTSGASALLGANATAAIAPEVYGGANMPAGYTASALLSVWPTTAAALLAVARQFERTVHYYSNPYSGAGNAALTLLSIAAAVPRNAISWRGNLAMGPTSTGNISMAVCPTSAGQGTPGYVAAQCYSLAGATVGGTVPETPIFTPQTTYFVTAAAGAFVINSYGYTF